MRYDFGVYLLEQMTKYDPDLARDYDGLDASAMTEMWDAVGISGKVSMLIKTLSNLQIFDPILAQIVEQSTEPTAIELTSLGEWEKTDNIGLSRGNGGGTEKRTLTIPTTSFDYQINMSKTEIKRAIRQQAELKPGAKTDLTSLELSLKKALESYNRKLRTLALTALFAYPTSEDPKLPILYRDTTTFTDINKVIPPKNGSMTFETAVQQEHHIVRTSPNIELLEDLKALIVNKGGNPDTIMVGASLSSWRKLRKDIEADEYAKLDIKSSPMNTEMERVLGSPLTQTINVVIPDVDLAVDYWFAVDLSAKLIRKTIPFNEEDRMETSFNTLSRLVANNGGNVTSELVKTAEMQMENATINGALNLRMNNIGFGIVNCGAGAVAWTGASDLADPYVAPTF